MGCGASKGNVLLPGGALGEKSSRQTKEVCTDAIYVIPYVHIVAVAYARTACMPKQNKRVWPRVVPYICGRLHAI